MAPTFLIASAMEGLAEAFTMAEKNGVARAMMAELVAGTIFNCPAYHNYGRLIAEERYEPALFKLSLGLKDIRLVLQTADSSRTPMPLASLVHDHFLAAVMEALSRAVVVIDDRTVGIDGNDHIRRTLDEPLDVFLIEGKHCRWACARSCKCALSSRLGAGTWAALLHR